MSLYISKSKYCSAVQCPKILWLDKHFPEKRDNSGLNESVLESGSEVGDLAMGLFGDFTEVPFNNLSQMIADTEALIARGEKVIAEASFSYKGLFCSVDILKNLGDGHVEMYEVKSSTAVNDIYLHDAAFQSYVLKTLGYSVDKICIVHIDSSYVRHGDIELDKFFAIEDVTDTVSAMHEGVEQRVNMLEAYLAQTEEPDMPIDAQCFAPYPCPFFGYCTRELPKPNVFDVGGMQTRTKLKAFKEGYVSFPQLEKYKKLNKTYLLQVSHEVHDLPPHIDTENIKAFMDTLYYPIYFLDFESFNPAIPMYDDSRPYQQITFQYSLHYIEAEGGELKHREFLACPGGDPRRAVAERLCEDIPEKVCVTAYNMSFEKTRIRELAELFPDLRDRLMDIHDRIIDLMVPFQKKYYYTKEMQGSYSIKYVLPALFPDAPELDYHNLEGVHDGAEASDTFKRMHSMTAEELEEYRTHLLRYCGLDTYAMVKVWEKLKEAAEAKTE